jgi:hypothetical protein
MASTFRTGIEKIEELALLGHETFEHISESLL